MHNITWLEKLDTEDCKEMLIKFLSEAKICLWEPAMWKIEDGKVTLTGGTGRKL